MCVCSVGSPVPVHYPSSLHSEPRVLPEPVASLRASHCSPVFYLLDNGKRRDAADLGLAIIICFICSFDWGGGLLLWPLTLGQVMVVCRASCMPAVLAVLWVPLSAADTFPHPKSFFCGRWKVFGRNEEKISLRAFFFFLVFFPPLTVSRHRCAHQASCLHRKHAKTGCPLLLWPCDPCVCADDCRCGLSAPDCLQGVRHGSLYGSDLGCRAWKKKEEDCVPDRLRLSLTVSD